MPKSLFKFDLSSALKKREKDAGLEPAKATPAAETGTQPSFTMTQADFLYGTEGVSRKPKVPK